jgi:hypothetical protein
LGSYATRSYVDAKFNVIANPSTYHVDLTNRRYVSANDNNTYIGPNAKVKSAAMAILPNLVIGNRVSVSWGYKIDASGNGSGTFYASQLSVYNVNSSTSWTLVGSESATRIS